MSLGNNASRLMTQTISFCTTPPHDLKPHKSIISQCTHLVSLLDSSKPTSEISQVHAFMVKTGLDRDRFFTSKLLASSIRYTRYADSIFQSVRNPNVFMYNTMLRAYCISEEEKKAFWVFNEMRGKGLELDRFSFIAALKVCAREMAVEMGRLVHGVVLRNGFVLFVDLKNSLLHFYCVCGRMDDARKAFDEMPQLHDLVSWNVLIRGYVRASQPSVGVELFRKLVRCGFGVSASTLLCVLSALGEMGNSLGAASVHGLCIKMGLVLSLNLNVVTALIEMYAKLGRIELAQRVFDGVAERDDVLWNCMIDKYAKVGSVEEAVDLLKQMKVRKVKPQASKVVGLLSACAALGLAKLGRFLYDYVEEEGLDVDATLGTALVEMSAKCGLFDKAVDVFKSMKTKNVKSWTAMILACGFHGQARKAVSLLCRMEEEGFRPNEGTFLATLSACNHGGLVSEAVDCFRKMVEVYGLLPKIDHYGCLIKLLGEAGLLEEAHRLINGLTIKTDAVAWRALLSACQVYRNAGLAECVSRKLGEMGEGHPAGSLLSSNYTFSGRLLNETRWKQLEKEKVNADTGSRIYQQKEKILKEAEERLPNETIWQQLEKEKNSGTGNKRDEQKEEVLIDAKHSAIEVNGHWIKKFLN